MLATMSSTIIFSGNCSNSVSHSGETTQEPFYVLGQCIESLYSMAFHCYDSVIHIQYGVLHSMKGVKWLTDAMCLCVVFISSCVIPKETKFISQFSFAEIHS